MGARNPGLSRPACRRDEEADIGRRVARTAMRPVSVVAARAEGPPARPAGVAGALHQPRTVLARIQSPRARGIEQSRTIRCSSGCASSRSRPTISTNSSWCASPAWSARCCRHDRDVRRRLHAGRAARADRRARRRTGRRAAAALARAAAANSAQAGIVIVDVADLSRARPRLAAGLFPAAGLSRC